MRGAEVTAERLAHGIPYHPEVIDWFHRAAEELGDADVATAVAKFPPYEGKVSAEEGESWRRQPAVLPATVEEKASL